MFDRIVARLRTAFYEINLFESGSVINKVIELEKLTTRIYIVLTVVLLLVIGLITLTLERSISAHVSTPTQLTFQHLSTAFSSTLQCPCSQIATQYQSFAKIHYRLHQVCTSAFITDPWIQTVSIDQDHPQMSFFWQIIAGLCKLSQSSIDMIINQFQVTTLLTPTAIDTNFLQIQTREAFDNVLSETQTIFFRYLVSIQRIISGNQFLSALGTNFEAQWTMINLAWYTILTSHVYDGCSCLNLDGCPRSSSISGIVSDCLMINGVLQSSLQCYYDDLCLGQLHPSLSSIVKLNAQNNARSKINATIKDLLNQFFIDDLSIEVGFDQYYRECEPQ